MLREKFSPRSGEMKDFIDNRVYDYYWNQDLNCANTTLHVLSELFHIKIQPQVLEATFGLNAGRCGTQCGLAEGALLFIGIYGSRHNLERTEIKEKCQKFSISFQKEFGSLLCKELRPRGFKPDNPPHLCENITKLAIAFAAEFISKELPIHRRSVNPPILI